MLDGIFKKMRKISLGSKRMLGKNLEREKRNVKLQREPQRSAEIEQVLWGEKKPLNVRNIWRVAVYGGLSLYIVYKKKKLILL